MSGRLAIAAAAFFLAVGLAGPPLDPLRIAGAALMCSAIALQGRFIAATAFVAVGLAGWFQHGHLRLTLLGGATVLGIAVRLWGARPGAASIIAAVAAAMGIGFFLLG